MHHFLSDIRTENIKETVVVRDKLVTAPESLKTNIPTNFNMKKLINDYHQRLSSDPETVFYCFMIST